MSPHPESYWLRCGLRMEHVAAELALCPQAAVQTITAFASAQGSAFLLITGPHGTGKSYIGASLLRQFGSGVFATMPELLQLQRTLPFEPQSDTAPTKGKLILTLKTCQILVIDELGRSSGGIDENQLLDDVLSFRHDRRLPTVLIANLDTAGIKSLVGKCVADRIAESYAHIAMTGASRRAPGRERGQASSKDMFTGLLPKSAQTQADPAGWREWLQWHGVDYTEHWRSLPDTRKQFEERGK